jgi:integrase
VTPRAYQASADDGRCIPWWTLPKRGPLWNPRGQVVPLVRGADHAGQPWHPMAVLRAFKRVLRAAGVRYRFPEQLRHTFASTMLSRNAPLLYVQRQGGWKSASVLLRVYARWMPQEYAADTAQSVHPSAPLLHPALDLAVTK